ncbi:protein LONGIFOLIA 1 [Corylus avellana]|uniref:protein LONGIFOLIA 1 n=1 Tax=Corylus avellana TaxID=13451 RepID=UPI00286D685E|nr:protein LONGIFOLIA 1 [Corylus avellana]
MAAKLLHSLADDNPDLHRQIGCMTGIFQLFDRPNIIHGRRISHKRLPPGNSHFNNGSLERESNNIYQRQTQAEINLSRNASEKQRISTESSRASFSSSCSSPLSSLDCNKTAQPETSSDRMIFPETPSRDPVINQPSTSPRPGRQSLDLRDVVKDSMYREARGLSIKTTTKEEAIGRALKRRDSPRPLQLPKSVDGSCGVGVNMKQNGPGDLKESLKVLAKLREAPWYYNEGKEPPMSSYESKDGPWSSISRDAPRFSYDGREINRLSFESRENLKSTTKHKELPRLSLDSREGSLWNSNSDSRPNHLTKNFQNGGNLKDKTLNLPQSSETQKRPPSVVAKLMGLETLPDSALANDSQLHLFKTYAVEDGDPFSRSLKTNEINRAVRNLKSPRNPSKDPTSPRWRNSDFVMKPISSSRLPIEPAPWKQLDGNRVSQKPAFRPVIVPPRAPNSFSSVYSEIEKRLKDIEFKQSGKDLRALKQILEAMQAKGLLETKKEEEEAENFEIQRDAEPKSIGSNQNSKSLGRQNPQRNHAVASPSRGSNPSRTFESPIVIMKPAKLVERSGIPASSVIPIDDISSLHKIPSFGFADSKRGSINSQTAKDQSPKNSGRNSSVSSTDKKASGRNMRSMQSSFRSQLSPKENTTSSEKITGSVSPRLQQKKLELEKRSRPPTPPSDSNKPRRQSNRHLKDSGSLGEKVRAKSSNLQLSDDQLSEQSYESRSLSCQGDDISVHSDGNIVLDSKIDIEVNSTEQSIEINGSQSPSMKPVKYLPSGSMQKKSTSRFDEDGSLAELATVAPEHPSPVSVLDASVYRDDELSPIKQIPNAPKGDSAQESNDSHSEDQWNTSDNPSSNSMGSCLTSEINRKKLQSIEHLVQKLRRLNSNHDEARTDYIASLCENSNPDHRYISEILLASGLLLRDLGSDLTAFQLHPSGHPINPELFFVLEQTKASSLLSKEDRGPGKVANSKLDREKFHRKLIFDAVNEILVAKLSLVGMCPEPWRKPDRLARKTVSAQKLLKELCIEIEQFQAKKLVCSLEEEEEDGLKSILWEDVMHRSGSWTDCRSEISGMVLDVERLVFKDLVDEIVIGEAACSRTKPGRRRKLFTK